MQSIFAVLILSVLSYQTKAAEVNPHIGKLLDGQTAYCIADEDIGTLAFAPTKVAVDAEDAGVEIRLSVKHLICKKLARGYAWSSRKPVETVVGVARDGSQMITHISEAEILVLQKTTDKSVSPQPTRLPLRNLDAQTVTHRLPMAALLLQDRSNVSFEIFQRDQVSVENKGELIYNGTAASGAYRLSFSLDNSSGKWQVKNLVIR